MAYEIDYAYFCHMGHLRRNNEDNYWCCGDMLPEKHDGASVIQTGHTSSGDSAVLALFDGMGGESCGETASWLGARACGEEAAVSVDLIRQDPKRFWPEACVRMNHAVCAYAAMHKIRSMGSTMAGMAFGEDQITACNLGDSRIYLLEEKGLRQLSLDHNAGHAFFGKPPLTQYLGLPEQEMLLEPHLEALPVKEGMTFLLCSDGLTDMLSDSAICLTLRKNSLSPSRCASLLLDQALAAGGKDNVTGIICRIVPASYTGERSLPRLLRIYHTLIGRFKALTDWSN